MSNIAHKRILKDLTELSKNPLHEHGIYTFSDESNFSTLYVLMIGPTETPYEDGFFFFTIHFPEKTYPNDPPSVKFYPMGSKTRFNPNLYTCGKVCLSIINTWQGPGWTACNTISSVLLSIQAMVLNAEPIRNEPGYTDTKNKHIVNSYSLIIEHEVCKTAILQNLKKLPKEFEIFLPTIEKHFMKHFIRILTKIQKYIDSPPSVLSYSANMSSQWVWGKSSGCHVYHFEYTPNYPQIKQELENYYFDVLTPKYMLLEEQLKEGKEGLTDEMGNSILDQDWKEISKKNEETWNKMMEDKKKEEESKKTKKKRLMNPEFFEKNKENEKKNTFDFDLEKIKNTPYQLFFEECATDEKKKKLYYEMIIKVLEFESNTNSYYNPYVKNYIESFKIMTGLLRFQESMKTKGEKFGKRLQETMEKAISENDKKSKKKNKDKGLEETENEETKEKQLISSNVDNTSSSNIQSTTSLTKSKILPPASLKGLLKPDLIIQCVNFDISITYMGPISKTNATLKEKPKTIEMLLKEYTEKYEQMFAINLKTN